MAKYLLKGGTVATFVQATNKPRAHKADVLIEGDTIVRIEKNIDDEPGVEVIDCKGRWITPGFVDTHKTVQGTITPEEVAIGQLAGCLDALNNGTTTMLDHFHAAHTPAHAEASLKATIESGARVVWAPDHLSSNTQLFPTLEFAKDTETLQWQRAKLTEWGANGGRLSPDGRVLLGLAYDRLGNGKEHVVPHEELLAEARAIPAQTITAHIHSAEQVLLWRDPGLLGPDVLFSHCCGLAGHTPLDEEAWRALKDSGAAIGATPEDEIGMALGHGLVVFDAVERGVKVGIGADTASINGGDMFTAMRFVLQDARHKEQHRIRAAKEALPFKYKYNSVDAFRLATLGGAEALGLANIIGTVEVGKKADLLIFDANSVNLAGADDPFSGIVFLAASEDTEFVLVAGEVVKKNHKLVREWAPVARELQKRAEDIRQRWPAEVLEGAWKKWYDANMN
ncbi:Metallo-dependent hydrolase [Dichomitus squalens LYAD-421 SS1]|uniref:Metallo-dependent hydrolase n=1 Tax=Dichomitus squalens (strain LYAD-421) TaxID=732165 RepID=R7T2Z4_DICSQ|nr:Metallo-dependent hydrolase [Dichomitus squalens LYAD-421 SS1]EJF62312.1 Metallo-dependent hydrolase [Dichomitus squalens LYAD-421 SS1]